MVTLGKDEESQVQWNLRMLDFARRLGFEIQMRLSLIGPLPRLRATEEFQVEHMRGVLRSGTVRKGQGPQHPRGVGRGERQRQLPRLTEWLGNCALTESLSSSDKMGQL